MHGERAHRVIDFHGPLEKEDGIDDQQAGHGAGQDRAGGIDKGQEPEMATNPASRPLQTMEGSGLRISPSPTRRPPPRRPPRPAAC
jgi:hypothetical protein